MASAGLSGVFTGKLPERHTFSVDEAAEILGISRWSAYEAIKKGELAAIKIGRRRVVPRRILEKMLGGE